MQCQGYFFILSKHKEKSTFQTQYSIEIPGHNTRDGEVVHIGKDHFIQNNSVFHDFDEEFLGEGIEKCLQIKGIGP